jgi:hypothetical protein
LVFSPHKGTFIADSSGIFDLYWRNPTEISPAIECDKVTHPLPGHGCCLAATIA